MRDQQSHDAEHLGSPMAIEEFTLTDADGVPTTHVSVGDEFSLRLTARCHSDVRSPVFGFGVMSATGALVYGQSVPSAPDVVYRAGELVGVDLTARATLAGGRYSAFANVRSQDLRDFHDRTRPIMFAVEGEAQRSGVAALRVRAGGSTSGSS
jgi:hypothetical protein